jgi:serine/threonine protein kinase
LKNNGDDFQDLIKQMLKIDYKERISAEEALKHIWFSDLEVKIFKETNDKI